MGASLALELQGDPAAPIAKGGLAANLACLLSTLLDARVVETGQLQDAARALLGALQRRQKAGAVACRALPANDPAAQLLACW